jgi:hypothetical protein
MRNASLFNISCYLWNDIQAASISVRSASVAEDGVMTRYVLLWAAALTAVAAEPARAQSVCGERVEIVNVLEAGHEERKTAAGLSGSGGVVELFTASNGSWTLLLTLPGGPTCMMGAGEAWEGWPQNGAQAAPRNTSLPMPPDRAG